MTTVASTRLLSPHVLFFFLRRLRLCGVPHATANGSVKNRREYTTVSATPARSVGAQYNSTREYPRQLGRVARHAEYRFGEA